MKEAFGFWKPVWLYVNIEPDRRLGVEASRYGERLRHKSPWNRCPGNSGMDRILRCDIEGGRSRIGDPVARPPSRSRHCPGRWARIHGEHSLYQHDST